MAENIQYKWLESHHWQVVSDVLHIEGMQEHQGLITDRYGNPTEKSDPNVGIYNNSHYSQDKFTLGLSLPLIREAPDELAIAYYEDSISAWVDFPSYAKGGYLYAEGP